MLLPLKLESLSQYNRKSQHVWKNLSFRSDYQQIKYPWEKSFTIFHNFLYVSTQCFFPKFELYAIYCKIIFGSLFLYLHELKKRVSDFQNSICDWRYYTLFCKQHFYKQRQVENGKNQAKFKHQPEVELLLFENYSLSSFTLSSRNNRK